MSTGRGDERKPSSKGRVEPDVSRRRPERRSNSNLNSNSNSNLNSNDAVQPVRTGIPAG